MIRLAFYVGSFAAGLAAWKLWQTQKSTGRALPVHEMADMVWYACADSDMRS
jgi:hypothetical protein